MQKKCSNQKIERKKKKIKNYRTNLSSFAKRAFNYVNRTWLTRRSAQLHSILTIDIHSSW